MNKEYTHHLLVKSLTNNKWSIVFSTMSQLDIDFQYPAWLGNYGNKRVTSYIGSKQEALAYIDSTLNNEESGR